jgi:hypothetical protein
MAAGQDTGKVVMHDVHTTSTGLTSRDGAGGGRPA